MRSLPGAGSSPGHVADSVIPAEPVRLDRPRLTALFDAGKAGTAGHVLVSAPAGSGKTVLVRQWTESSRRLAGTRSVMLTAAADDDAASLLRQLRDRAVVSVPEQEPALSQLRPPAQPGAVTGFVTRFLTVTAGSGVPVAIVIDDVHRLVGADCLAVLQALIERAPEGVRVVLATRRDPALPVHRWRLSGVLTGISAADLALTPGETRDMAQAYGLELSDRGHALIHECTEGWVGGVRLAIASLSASDDPEAGCCGCWPGCAWPAWPRAPSCCSRSWAPPSASSWPCCCSSTPDWRPPAAPCPCRRCPASWVAGPDRAAAPDPRRNPGDPLLRRPGRRRAGPGGHLRVAGAGVLADPLRRRGEVV